MEKQGLRKKILILANIGALLSSILPPPTILLLVNHDGLSNLIEQLQALVLEHSLPAPPEINMPLMTQIGYEQLNNL